MKKKKKNLIEQQTLGIEPITAAHVERDLGYRLPHAIQSMYRIPYRSCGFSHFLGFHQKSKGEQNGKNKK